MTNSEPLYLKPNVQVEPLWDHWYAWSHLVPPATAARNLTGRHLRIMDSYLAAPQAHRDAARNPKLIGGPFIDHPPEAAHEIRDLRDRTVEKRAHLSALSDALASLNAMLTSEAKGASLQPLYSSIPDALKGFVELGYDLNHQPSFRLIEPLLYRSHYYDETAQGLMLSTISGDDRPFVLSTPRLGDARSLHLKWAFADSRVKRLFQLKTSPMPWSLIRTTFGISGSDESILRSFCTPAVPRPYQPYAGRGVRWRYFGHACILIETKNVSVLLDPVLSYTYESSISRYTYADLPDAIDFVLITHNHQDHLLLETLLQIRHKVDTIVVPRSGGGFLHDPSLKLTLEQIGFRNVRELSELESIDAGALTITGLPFLGEHADLSILSKLAYLVRADGRSLLFGADSCNLEPLLYKHVHEAVGDIDVLFLGMECDGAPLSWLYGPLLFSKPPREIDQSRRLAGSDFVQALDLVNRFRCREVYVYAMGQEPWLNYVMSVKYTDQSRPIVESNRLLGYCASHGITAERLFGEKEILIERTMRLCATS